MIEEWKDVIGFEDKYQISNLGNIRLKGNNLFKVPIMELSGYYYTYLDGNKISYIHRLVAQAFIPNPNNYPCVNHINGTKKDNKVNNLEWCTYSHNNKEAYKLGLKKPHIGEINKHKAIVMLDDNMQEICVFKKVKYADKLFKTRTSGNIIRAINSGIKAYGFYWRYYDRTTIKVN